MKYLKVDPFWTMAEQRDAVIAVWSRRRPDEPKRVKRETVAERAARLAGATMKGQPR